MKTKTMIDEYVNTMIAEGSEADYFCYCDFSIYDITGLNECEDFSKFDEHILQEIMKDSIVKNARERGYEDGSSWNSADKYDDIYCTKCGNGYVKGFVFVNPENMIKNE